MYRFLINQDTTKILKATQKNHLRRSKRLLDDFLVATMEAKRTMS